MVAAPNPLARQHKEHHVGQPKRQIAAERIRKIRDSMPKPTPLQQTIGRAMDHAYYLRTRQALLARDSRGYESLKNPGARNAMLSSMQEEINRTLGEAGGSRLPIERGMY